MAILLSILLEAVLIMFFLWIGKSIMKAQIYFKTLVIASLAGACASQVPFVGVYLSTAVVLFFLWKMARIDMFPDGALIVLLGKGISFVAMIYIAGAIWEHSGGIDTEDLAEMAAHVVVYEDDEGTLYYMDADGYFYLDADEEKVYVDPEVLGDFFVAMAAEEEAESEPVEEVVEDPAPEALAAAEATPEAVATDFSEPYLSDLMVRGEPVPFLLFVPQGWMVKKDDGMLTMRFDDHDFIHCYASDTISDNKSYLRAEVDRVLSQYRGYRVARQEIVEMDRRQWARIQLANQSGDQVLLITHGGNFGCYSIELNGSFRQLSAHKQTLNRIITSFKFPASTYFIAKAESGEEG